MINSQLKMFNHDAIERTALTARRALMPYRSPEHAILPASCSNHVLALLRICKTFEVRQA